MKKYLNKNIIMGILAVLIFSLSMTMLNTSKTQETASGALSNELIGWGIKRNNNHEQPDVGSKNKKLLDEAEGYCLGNSEKKYIYLTFDNGYEAGYTSKILDALKNNNVQATFFITAHYLNTQPELVKQMIDDGHIVGNHTVNHKSMPSLSDDQIKKEVMDLHQAIKSKFNYEMKYVRPPKGEYSERTLSVCNSLGYKTIMWSFAYADWDENKQPDEAKAKEMIFNNLHNGEIMLLHGTSKTNANILDSVLKEIKAQGYEIKAISEFEK